MTLIMVALLHVRRSYFGKIQDKDDDYYMQFNLVICGLDSVEARRWINATLVNLVDEENPESLKPLIDGGTEGLLLSTSQALNFNLYLRFQGPSPRDPSHCVVLLRMLPRYAKQAHDISYLHNC
jgi:hypothetical protein